MVRCPKCGTDSPDQSRFCRACGEALVGRGAGAPIAPGGMSAEERARRLLEEAFRLSEEGRVLAAIQTCQQAIAINPNSTSAHSLLGTLYERQGDRDNAIREYEQVLTLSPGSTVERRRLNELMGVPAAREAAVAGISPRAARMAVTGMALVVVAVLIGAIAMTIQQPARPNRLPSQAPRVASGPLQQEAAVPQQATSFVPSPGSFYPSAPRLATPRWNQPSTFAQQPRQMQNRRQYGGGGQWVAPGTYVVPMTAGQRAPGQRRHAPVSRPPFVGAVPYNGPLPAVSTRIWRQNGGYGRTPDTGRNYYFQGDYQRAIDAYQSYLSQNPSAGAAPREELAWVYAEAGDRSRANQEYRRALEQYQTDLNRSHNVEAARHGVRTCESALKALGK